MSERLTPEEIAAMRAELPFIPDPRRLVVTLEQMGRELKEARSVARLLFWGEIPPERIEAVAVRVKAGLRMKPDEYLDWLED